jgi:hypothetical protein
MYSTADTTTLTFDVDGATGTVTNASGYYLSSTSSLKLGLGSTLYLRLASTTLRPEVNEGLSCGVSVSRWSNVYSVLGNYSGILTCASDVVAARFVDGDNNTYLLDPNNTTNSLVIAGNIVMASSKTVDGVDISAHTHKYNKVVSQAWDTLSGFTTSSWEITGTADYGSLPIRRSSGGYPSVYAIIRESSFGKTYVYMADDSSGTGAAWVSCIANEIPRCGTQPHIHYIKLEATESAAPS